MVHAEPVAFTVRPGFLDIDGRSIPLAGEGSWDVIARQFARVPNELRPLVHTLAVSATPSSLDAVYAKKYNAPVLAGMSANADGDITIYPHGIDELADPDGFVRNFMHELGHTWSLAAWRADPAAEARWLAAMRADTTAPSYYAVQSFKSSGEPFEDAAEATALYFVTRGTPLFERYRAVMPARFALVAARFGLPL